MGSCLVKSLITKKLFSFTDLKAKSFVKSKSNSKPKGKSLMGLKGSNITLMTILKNCQSFKASRKKQTLKNKNFEFGYPGPKKNLIPFSEERKAPSKKEPTQQFPQTLSIFWK